MQDNMHRPENAKLIDLTGGMNIDETLHKRKTPRMEMPMRLHVQSRKMKAAGRT